MKFGEQEIGEDFLDTYGKTEDKKVDRQAYSDAIKCINQYLNAINIKNDAYYMYDEKGNYVLAVDEIKIKQNIYNLLSKNYVEKNQITIQNVYDKIETIDTMVLFVPLEISMIQDKDIKSFAVFGLLESPQNYNVVGKKTIIVNIDIKNNTYSIEEIKDNTDVESIKLSNTETSITANENNQYTYSYTNYEEAVKDYINLYKRLALGMPEKMYELLDKDYRSAKFGNLENFKKYVEDNRKEIIGINPQQYQVLHENENEQYIVIDQNGNYYIIREKGVLDYTIILDTYTIDLPEFTEKYNSATNEEKVLMNIQKIFEAINDGDYKYAYNKLDPTFRTNNFKTLTDFENYVKKNFFSENKLASGKVEKQSDIYLYDIIISDASGKNTNTVNKTFVMQLKEGTDFVMSFNVK